MSEHVGGAVPRRAVLGGMAVGAAGLVGAVTLSGGPASAAPVGRGKPRGGGAGYLVGCGKADMTGAIAGQGMMGYSELDQVAEGLLQRCYARAYIIGDRGSGKRVVFVNADIACLFESHRVGVMELLRKRFGDLYTEQNVNLNATHNHNSCGGTAWDYGYSIASLGFKANSYQAEIEGIYNAIVRAHEQVAPGTIEIGRTELGDASANRSMQAFVLNPDDDKRVFPHSIDPAVTVLRLRQGGREVGHITWFATHGTSLTDANRLISSDNKGYASYRAETENPGVVASFPQTNAGDMTPNLWVRPFHPGGPTADHRENRALIGERQYQASRRAFGALRPLSDTGVESATHYVNMADVLIDGSYTPDGRAARTSPAMMGAGAVATSSEDNVETQLPILYEGETNPLVTAMGGMKTPVAQWIRDVQAPKLIIFPLGIMPPMPWIPQVLPIQIMRIGELILAAGPAEYTIVAGLRVRQIVAHAFGTSLENVLLQGYSNAYSQYVTTPEEYVSQQYEGGETQFGRWTLSAYMQEFDRLARAMVAGKRIDHGPVPPDKSKLQPDLLLPVPPDTPVPGRKYGDVTVPPNPAYPAGATVSVEFVGAHPNNNFHTEGTYFEVQRKSGTGWERAFDDNADCTELHWSRPAGNPSASLIRIEWHVPVRTRGRFRIRYFGDAKSSSGKVTPFTGVSPEFAVNA